MDPLALDIWLALCAVVIVAIWAWVRWRAFLAGEPWPVHAPDSDTYTPEGASGACHATEERGARSAP